MSAVLEPRTLDDLLDMAKARAGIHSDNALARALGIKNLAPYRRRGVIPNDETALKLAELAGLPGPVVLALCHQWAAERDEQDAVARAWREILKRVAQSAAALLLALSILSIPNGGKIIPAAHAYFYNGQTPHYATFSCGAAALARLPLCAR